MDSKVISREFIINLIKKFMESIKNHYSRIIDGKYGVLSVFDKAKDRNGLSVVKARCISSGAEVVIKIMTDKT